MYVLCSRPVNNTGSVYRPALTAVPTYVAADTLQLRKHIESPSLGGVARGCGPHQAALARGRQIGENCKKNSREISDCKFHMFASAIKTKSFRASVEVGEDLPPVEHE